MTSGHQTTLAENHLPTDDFIAYHTERAKGGVGLIVMEAHGVHKTGLNTPHAIDASNPKIIETHSKLATNVHAYGARLFAQLMHNGRESYMNDDNTDVVAPSAIPTERFHIIPRELEVEEIEEIIDGFVQSAVHLKEAGLDGLEFIGSHSYLLGQFWTEKMNQRQDEWGGSFYNRLRFAREVITRVRKAIGDDMVLGMRLSLESKDDEGLSTEETLDVIKHLNDLGLLDYWSLVIGSSATYKGSSYIVPPSTESADDLFARTNEVREIIGDLPLIITSRIYKPDIAEGMIQEGFGDVVGMTRALIADPHMPNKILNQQEEQITPCIACNQGCIGRYQEHLPIRCTVNPVTGREQYFNEIPPAGIPRKVLVIGGGPSGMMAAITARRRGHDVELIEENDKLGGQLNVMQGALNREQVNDWREYLERELKRLGVRIQLEKRFSIADLKDRQVDSLILAGGSQPDVPHHPSDTTYSIYTSWDVLDGESIKEDSVLVLDWKGDWPGVQAAELLAKQGKNVELVSGTYGVGEVVQQYIRNKILSTFDKYNVTLSPHFKLSEMKEDHIVIKHMFSGRKEVKEPEAVIVAVGNNAEKSLQLYRELKDQVKKVHRIGDALSPRSLDEATWEGFKLGISI